MLGNALDKGQGVLRPRADDLRGLEVVLGNGAVLTTGELWQAGRASGPDATRLFCQSNFGVVTAAVIALVPQPERTSYVHAGFDARVLPAVVDRLARLRRERVIDHVFCIGEMTLAPDAAASTGFTVFGPLLGRASVVAQALELVRHELGGLPGCRGLRGGDVAALSPGDPLHQRGQHFLGMPSCEPLRQRFGVSSCDLDADARTGFSVVQMSLPPSGSAAGEAPAVLQACARDWRLPVQPHFTTVSENTLNLMSMIRFPRDDAGIRAMLGLRDALRARLAERGFRPSREGVDALRDLAGEGNTSDPAWAGIKNALDPHGVIAPGRYVAAAR